MMASVTKPRVFSVERETWPIDGSFTISRGSKTTAEVVTVCIVEDGVEGYGECVPYARYGETVESVIAEVKTQQLLLAGNADIAALQVAIQSALPAGAARNAIDCALWDLAAKQNKKRVWELASLPAPQTVTTAYTLSLDTPENMHAAAEKYSSRPLLKLKLAGDGDVERVAAVRSGAPTTTIIVDANEGWCVREYESMVPKLHELGVSMIEQPLPADDDAALASVERPITICADESCHDLATLDKLAGRYDMINIKLDKTGGLTEAIALQQAAIEQGFEVMIGCMVATSLAMAPATLLTGGASVVDLDGPLLLAKDRQHGLDYSNYSVAPPQASLWG